MKTDWQNPPTTPSISGHRNLRVTRPGITLGCFNHICILTRFVPILSDPAIGVDLFHFAFGYLMAKIMLSVRNGNLGPTRRLSKILDSAVLSHRTALLRLIGCGNCICSYFGEARDIIGHFYSETQTNSSRYSDHSFLNVFTHATFMFGFLPDYSFNTVLPDWSIGLEMQFYLLSHSSC